MTWVITDDAAPMHRKFFRAGVAAYGWWQAATCYCSSHLTDGFVPDRDLLLVFPGMTMEQVRALIDILIREGSIHPVSAGHLPRCHAQSATCPRRKWNESGLVLHDYLRYQSSRLEVLSKRRARSASGRQGGIESTKKRVANAQANAQANGVAIAQAKTGGLLHPRANPTPTPTPSSTSTKPPIVPLSGDGFGFDRFYRLYPRKKAPAAAKRAWRLAVAKSSEEQLLVALTHQLPEFARRPPDRVPYPASWLSGEHWRNEPDKDPSDTDNPNPYADWPSLHECGACKRGCHDTEAEAGACRSSSKHQ